MEKIFLKNYKGFSHQIVKIEDVNFLVGENSTGKTSLLKIINLLSSHEFWYEYEFNNNEVELGYFEEIINKRSSDNFFQLGIEKDIISGRKKGEDFKKERFRINFEFHQKQSVPVLRKLKVRIDDLDVLVKFTPKRISYQYKEASKNSFDEWVVDYSFPKKFKILTTKRKTVPVGYLTFLIQKEIDSTHLFPRGSFGDELLYTSHKWIAPIRAKAKRTYDSYKVKFSPEGEHVPSILKQIFVDKSSQEKEKIRRIIEDFGHDSNLFDSLEIRELGKNFSSPFEIIVKYKDMEVKLPNVGYGVSQSLPVITEIVSSKATCFSIQQPEVHLHPKAQSAFGKFIYSSTIKDDNKFIIETHSDFTINRFRYLLSKSQEKRELKSKILFFERNDTGNFITEININKDGSLPYDVPQSYKEFFIDEELKMLEI